MNIPERDLLENILTAEILILLKLEKLRNRVEGKVATENAHAATEEIKRRRPELIQLLLSEH